MGIRFSLVLTLALILLGAAFFFFTRQPSCTDPAGCIHLAPGEPLAIGIGVMTSGNGKEVSSEMVQGANLAAQVFAPLAGHAIQIQPFYGNCLPDTVNPATIDLSADRQLLVALGPTCPQDSAEFIRRLSLVRIGMVSPVPYAARPQPGVYSFYPDVQALVDQTVQLLSQKSIARVAVLATSDTASQEIAAGICASTHWVGQCFENPDQAAASTASFDAYLAVALDETQPNLPSWISASSHIPWIVVSFSRPHALPGESNASAWISLQAWDQENEFTSAYTALYQAQPDFLSAWVVYTQFPYLLNAIKEVAQTTWDGSLSIPRQALWRQATTGQNPDRPNQFSCLPPQAACPGIPLGFYSPSENGTYIVDPLIQ